MSYFILFLLLALSFFFSGTETALTAISLPLLNGRAENGDKKAQILMQMKQKPDTLLGTLLLGNNIVNIALTALSTSLLIAAFGPQWGVWISTFLVSFIVLIFAEILPKTYAMQMTIPVVFFVAWPLYVLIKILAPIVHALNWVSRQALKIFPKQQNTAPAEEIAKEELRGTLSLQQNQNVLRREKGMLSSVLDLSEVTLGDILVDRSRVSSLSVDTPIPDILEVIAKTPYSRIPLFQGRRDNIVGILHIKKALKLKTDFEQNKHINVLDYCAKPHFALNTVTVLDQLSAFRRHKNHFAVVVNEYGDVLGVVTLQDILEEIIGDMSDDTIGTKPASVVWSLLPDGTYRLNGNATIRDVNRAFHWDLPDEHAATLAGLLMYFTEKIPEENQQFNFDGWLFTVARRDKNRLLKIDVLPPKKEE
ncbi:MAG: HlyC/CorC family transporter [Alphaproteobacteria bacterium]